MPNVCLVHLVRKSNGIEPLRAFIQSYKNHPAGIPHNLLLVFKGFTATDFYGYEDVLRDVPHQALFVFDWGFDIRPYFLTVRHFNYQYFVFLNSYSKLLCENWMEKMYRYVTMPNVGAVGATGSWESHYCHSLEHQVRRPLFRQLLNRANRFILKQYFSPFPNYHLRTNAFMASRDLLLKISVPLILTKQDAHKFESGLKGFTRQILDMNKRVLVIGRDGQFYEKENWSSSGTFRQDSQNNLLVADNQTNTYLAADLEMRRQLSLAAWGNDGRLAR